VTKCRVCRKAISPGDDHVEYADGGMAHAACESLWTRLKRGAKTCPGCGARFTAPHAGRRYCRLYECQLARRRLDPRTHSCAHCGEAFTSSRSDARIARIAAGQAAHRLNRAPSQRRQETPQ